jgi:hypothetical protein
MRATTPTLPTVVVAASAVSLLTSCGGINDAVNQTLHAGLDCVDAHGTAPHRNKSLTADRFSPAFVHVR